jgi:hypothetical protein
VSYFSFCSYGGVRSWHCFLVGLRCCYLFFGAFMWNSYQHFLLSCCFLCVLRSIKTTRVSKFFEWLSRIDKKEKKMRMMLLMMIMIIVIRHFAGCVAVAW